MLGLGDQENNEEGHQEDPASEEQKDAKLFPNTIKYASGPEHHQQGILPALDYIASLAEVARPEQPEIAQSASG